MFSVSAKLGELYSGKPDAYSSKTPSAHACKSEGLVVVRSLSHTAQEALLGSAPALPMVAATTKPTDRTRIIGVRLKYSHTLVVNERGRP